LEDKNEKKPLTAIKLLKSHFLKFLTKQPKYCIDKTRIANKNIKQLPQQQKTQKFKVFSLLNFYNCGH